MSDYQKAGVMNRSSGTNTPIPGSTVGSVAGPGEGGGDERNLRFDVDF